MKPGNVECSESLKSFLLDVFAQQQSQFTQFSYLRDVNHSVVSEQPPNLLKEDDTPYIAKPTARCVILWLRKPDQQHLRKLGFAYCHALKENNAENKAIQLDLSIEVGSEFIPCGGSYSEKLEGLGWRAKITKAHFIAKERLIEFLDAKDPKKNIKRPSSATHYILYEFSETVDIPIYDLTTPAHKSSRYMAVTTTWKEILKNQNRLSTS